MSYRKNLATGLFLTVFSLAYLAGSFAIEPFTGSGATPLDARFAPQLWGSLLFILSLILTLRGLKERKAAGGSAAPAGPGFQAAIKENKEVILVFVALFFYAFFMERIGFLITSAIFVFCATLLLTRPDRRLTRRNLIAAGISGIVSSVLINYLFIVALNVRLPRGILGF